MILNLILLLYVLPMVINISFQYFEEKAETIGDLLKFKCYYFTPVFNLLISIIIPFYFLDKFYGEKFGSWWERFKNIKIR